MRLFYALILRTCFALAWDGHAFCPFSLFLIYAHMIIYKYVTSTKGTKKFENPFVYLVFCHIHICSIVHLSSKYSFKIKNRLFWACFSLFLNLALNRYFSWLEFCSYRMALLGIHSNLASLNRTHSQLTPNLEWRAYLLHYGSNF